MTTTLTPGPLSPGTQTAAPPWTPAWLPPQAPPPLWPPAAATGEPQPPQPPPKRRGLRTAAAATLLALVAGVAGGYAALRFSDEPATTAATAVTAVSDGSVTQALAKVAAAVSPSVVEIGVTSSDSTSSGSGFVWRSDGLIVTNAHVVSGAGDGATLSVTFADGSKANATVVATDSAHDVALIKAAGVSGLTPVTLGSSSSVHIGDTVLAIGSPIGLENTVTSGIVSALHREVQISDGNGGPFRPSTTTTLKDAIQTDAAVNPGNSGGPLVDARGHVIGMTTAMASVNGDSGSNGLGFAIPVDTVRSAVTALLS